VLLAGCGEGKTASTRAPQATAAAQSTATPAAAKERPPEAPAGVRAAVSAPGFPGPLGTGFGSVWVAGHRNGALHRIDPRTNQVVAAIEVPDTLCGDLAFGGGAVWASNCGQGGVSWIYRIDPRTNRVVRRVSLPGCDHDHGLHLDPRRRLAFVACDGNATLLVFDLRTKKVTGRFSVGDDPDVLDFDPGLRRLYVAAESGVVAVFAERGRSLVKLGQAFLADGAHSVAVDPRTHLVYFPLADVDGRPVLRIMAPR